MNQEVPEEPYDEDSVEDIMQPVVMPDEDSPIVHVTIEDGTDVE